MGATEWVLLIVVVILIPLVIAVAVTLWSLEQARQRNRRNRPGSVRRVAAPTEASVTDADTSTSPQRIDLEGRQSDDDGRREHEARGDDRGDSDGGSGGDSGGRGGGDSVSGSSG